MAYIIRANPRIITLCIANPRIFGVELTELVQDQVTDSQLCFDFVYSVIYYSDNDFIQCLNNEKKTT